MVAHILPFLKCNRGKKSFTKNSGKVEERKHKFEHQTTDSYQILCNINFHKAAIYRHR